MAKPLLRSLVPEELAAAVGALGGEAYRARQVAGWLHLHDALRWEEMRNLPRPLRTALAEQHDLQALTPVERQISADGTRKFLFRLRDGQTVESVIIPMESHATFCLSTQVGCAMACRFCATARGGLVRNLEAGEILEQITHLRRDLAAEAVPGHGDRQFNAVFMGMGEPLDNLPALLQALAVLVDRSGFGYAQERLTVCTVGHVPGIHALRELGWKRLGLALSLNSADDGRRAELMPHSVRYSLAEIQQALLAFRQRKNLALGVHWCLLPGINDGERDAAQLAAFVAPLGRTFVHVIPYNPGTAPIARAPHEDEVVAFVARLRAHGLAVRRRITKGRSVMAACGQLGKLPGEPAT